MENQKVRNATRILYDDIQFRSKLEAYCYKKLKEAGIRTDYEKHRFELFPAFEYKNKKYRAMTYLPDFVCDTCIIECKGWGNDQWALREKMFKYHLLTNDIQKDFHVVSTQKEVDALINTLKENG